MTKITTKIALASLLAVGFASSAFASEASDAAGTQYNQPVAVQAQRAPTGTEAYAYAPASHHNAAVTAAEQREFDRATAVVLTR